MAEVDRPDRLYGRGCAEGPLVSALTDAQSLFMTAAVPVAAAILRRSVMNKLAFFLAGLVVVGYACAVAGMTVGVGVEHGQEEERAAPHAASSREPFRQHPDRQPAPAPRFEAFDIADGLAADEVDAILQDRQGFLWVGTWSGLHRYDGASFTAFLHDPADSLSLGNGWVWDLHEDRAGHLWIATDGGLSRFDPTTETFTNFRPDPDHPDDPATLGTDPVRTVVEDAAGMIWVGTAGGGVSRLDPATGTLTHYRHDPDDPHSLSRDDVYPLLPDPSGALWVGTPDGLSRLDPATGVFTRFEDDAAPPDVFSLLRDRGGALWVGTINDGLYRRDPATGRFTHYASDASDPGALGQEWVLSLLEDAAGTLWVGTDGGGLHRYDPATDAFVRYVHDPADPQSLSDDRVLSLFEDRAGVLWVGTHGGLNRRYPLSRVLAHESVRPGDDESLSANDVTSFLEDRTGALWVGTDGGGLNRRDPATGTFEHFTHDPTDAGSLDNDAVIALAEDDDGALWVGTYDGLFRRDPRTGRFSRPTVRPDSGSSWPHVPVLDLAFAEGHLWVASYDGLLDIEPRTGRATRYVPGLDDRAAPNFHYVLSVLPDPSAAVWFGSFRGGLGRLDAATGAVTHLRYDGQDPSALRWGQVASIYRGASGTLWAGTEEGLVRLDADGREVTRYRRAEGLPSPLVVSILGDTQGRLWVTTVYGLTWFDPRAETFQSYDARDGLAGGGVLYRSPRTGTIYVGDTRGYYAFDPAVIGEEAPPSPLVLTSLRLLGDPVRAGAEGSVLDRPMWGTESLRLRYDDRVVTFGFAALDFRAPAKHRYAVRLDGFDDDWREVGERREATFTNLSPGRYTFRVRVAGSSGVWSESEASVRLQVLPPWWRTVWAYLTYGLLFVAGVFLVDRGQRRRLTARERDRSRERERALRIEASEATTNYLQAENKRQTQELDQARALQLSMLPTHMPEHEFAEVAAHMQTATEVGGDYYDFHLAGDGTLTLAIGDATGHGMKAGTMVTAVKSLFTTYADERDPAAVLQKASQALRAMRLPKLYMAFALGKLRGRTLEIVGAGMPPALVYRAASRRIETVSLKGMPLGGPMAYPYRSETIVLETGDTLLLMSDGFPELQRATGEMIGYENVRAVFADVAAACPEEIVRHFEQTAAAWLGGRPRNDDMTFVVLTLRDRASPRMPPPLVPLASSCGAD